MSALSVPCSALAGVQTPQSHAEPCVTRYYSCKCESIISSCFFFGSSLASVLFRLPVLLAHWIVSLLTTTSSPFCPLSSLSLLYTISFPGLHIVYYSSLCLTSSLLSTTLTILLSTISSFRTEQVKQLEPYSWSIHFLNLTCACLTRLLSGLNASFPTTKYVHSLTPSFLRT